MVEPRAQPVDVEPGSRLWVHRLARIRVPLLIVAAVVLLTVLVFGTVGVQDTINGLVTSSVIIPAAVGLTLVYGVRKFANFAQGELMTLGAYVAYLLNAQLGGNLLWAFLIVPIVLGIVGVMLELFVFSKFEGKGIIAPMVASIGLSLFLQNLIAVIWGTDIRYFRVPAYFDIQLPYGLHIPPLRVAIFFLGIAFMVFVHLLLTRTTLGKAMRATSDNLELARTTGIRTRRVILWTWFVSAALSGIGGIILGLYRYLVPTVGFEFLLLFFAAVILGGIGSAYGAMLGGLIIGLANDLSLPWLSWLSDRGWLVHGTGYQFGVAFVIMVIVLLVRPEGILGIRRERGGTGAIRWLRSRLLRSKTKAEAEGE